MALVHGSAPAHNDRAGVSPIGPMLATGQINEGRRYASMVASGVKGKGQRAGRPHGSSCVAGQRPQQCRGGLLRGQFHNTTTTTDIYWVELGDNAVAEFGPLGSITLEITRAASVRDNSPASSKYRRAPACNGVAMSRGTM